MSRLKPTAQDNFSGGSGLELTGQRDASLALVAHEGTVGGRTRKPGALDEVERFTLGLDPGLIYQAGWNPGGSN